MTVVSIGQDPGLNTGTIQKPRANNSDTFALFASATGNTVAQSLAYSGDTTGAAISAAATNATYSGFLAAGGSTVPTYGAGMGMTGAGNYASGGVGPQYLVPGEPSMGDPMSGNPVASDVESILADSALSQAYLIGIQAQLGQQQSTFTALSNAMNVKFGMERSAIQNFKS
ncbi:MAG: hypothetical protein HQM16_13460 [Deltaproteobacteria bacterium]|nr:hypothetical protein [Deltaproteobacteria bacterium]